ncbi:Maestro heat-like repeat-containing protein family member 1 [Halotydeus destructor]|nr:Maestro heat-like repeat-containing protein family member 1 [Halotydeus destructor]
MEESTVSLLNPQIYKRIISEILNVALAKELKFNDVVCNSLTNLGKKHPDIVVKQLLGYFEKDKLKHACHKVSLVNLLLNIIKPVIRSIDKELRHMILTQCIAEIKKKENQQELQQSSSDIVVAIGSVYHDEVMDVLFELFQPETLPSHYIVKTLADLSVENPFGMVPYIKAVLGTMVAHLKIVKTDDNKWIYAYCFARFSEAIQEYLANIDKAPDPSVTKEYFSSEVDSAFEVVFLNWFGTRDIRLKQQVIETLGLVSPLLSTTKVAEFVPKLVASFLSLYSRSRQVLNSVIAGKEVQQHVIAQSFNLVIDSAIECSSNCLQPQLQELSSTLFTQICNPVDYSQPTSIRHHNELLRCFATLNKVYSEIIIPFILQKLETNSIPVKCGGLSILKHLINSSTDQIETKIPSIMVAVRLVLSDESNRVKKLIVQVIVALAHHGFLIAGGEELIKFLVKQCATTENTISPRQSLADANAVTDESLKSMCENVMHLLVTTVQDIETVLWPYLFELLFIREYSNAIPVILKSLSTIGEKLRSDQTRTLDYEIDFARCSKAMTAHSLLAKLFVIVGSHISESTQHGVHLMVVLSPVIHKSLSKLWDTVLPEYFDIMTKVDNNTWRNNFCALVNQSIIEIDDNDFAMNLGKSLVEQFPDYENSDRKYFSLLLIGNVARRLGSKSFTTEVIDVLFPLINHGNELERKGLAHVMGQSAASFLDLVLVKLEQFAEAKKGFGLLNLVMDSVSTRSHQSEQEKVRASVILSYGYACTYAAPDLLVTRIETPIIRTMAAYYQQSRDITIKKCFLESVKIIADSVHPDSLSMSFTFRSRNELLHEMITILRDPEMKLEEISLLAISAVASLIKLEPKLESSEKNNIVDVVGKVVLSTYNNELLLKSFENVASQILIKDDYVIGSLELIVNGVTKWFLSQNDNERENAMEFMSLVLSNYHSGITNGRYHAFPLFCRLMTLIAPRTSDPAMKVRTSAIKCAILVCTISDTMKNRSDSQEQSIAVLTSLLESCKDQSPEEIGKVVAQCLSKRLQLENCRLSELIKDISAGVLDCQAEGSICVCVIIGNLVETHSEELAKEVPSLCQALFEKMKFITDAKVKEVFYSLTLRALSSTHLKSLLTHLLSRPLPLDQVSRDVWRNLTVDPLTWKIVTDHLMQEISDEIIYEIENGNLHIPKRTLIAAKHQPLAATSALAEIFQTITIDMISEAHYGPLLGRLLLAFSAYVGAIFVPQDSSVSPSKVKEFSKSSSSPFLKPSMVALEALKSFFIFSKQHDILKAFDGNSWILPEFGSNMIQALTNLATALSCPVHAKRMTATVTYLSRVAVNENINQRSLRIIFFTEFLSQHIDKDEALTELLTNSILNALEDTSPHVRQVAIRGLGLVGQSNTELLPKFAGVIVAALLTALDEKDHEELAEEALQGFCNVVDHISLDDLSGSLYNIVLIVRTYFDRESSSLRAKAFIVFSKLVKFALESDDMSLRKAFQGSLIQLVIYVNDDSNDVIRCCKIALRSLSDIMTGGLKELCQRALIAETNLHFGEFVNSFSKHLAVEDKENYDDFILTACAYLKSERTVIQCNAITLIGFLLANQQIDAEAETVAASLAVQDKAIASLLSLLNCASSSVVRNKTVQALCLL